MTIELPELPYPMDSLEPHISEETLEYHYGKHHATYVTKLNGLIEGTEFADQSLESIIHASDGAVFNNAAQIWNHTFYWNCLSPHGGGEPDGDLYAAIVRQWSSFSIFRQKFTDSAIGNFGSGWTWLAKSENDELFIVNTSNAETPLTARGLTPLLTVDIWEHAYYIDYRNARPRYLEAFWALVNWEFVATNFRKA